jgi:hypothetical protein
MSYEQIKSEIKNAPETWLPGLLVCVIKTSLENNVFKPGGAARIAKEVEDEYNEIMAAMPNDRA